jgi:hypothetical protein
MCQNSKSALQEGMKRGDIFVNPRGFYCFRREEDRSLGLVSHSYFTNQGPIAASSETYIEHFCSSPSVGGTGFFFARLFVPVARLFLLSNLLSFVGRNQTQTTKDSLDRTLSDTTTAKSTVHLSSEDREQLADAMREGEFDWAQSMLPGAAEQEETKPASQEVGNPKI